MFSRVLIALGLSLLLAPGAQARRFDAVTGIVFACGAATGFDWTGEACRALSAEFRTRAEAARLPFVEVPVTADFATRKREVVGGFDEDKAVRVLWTFVESDSVKGRISAALSSTFKYELTKKDHPNIAPGQFVPLNFYAQSALFDPGVTYAQAMPDLDLIADAFFEVGGM